MFKLESFLLGELYLARLDRFGDPLEGTLPRQNRNLLDKAPDFERKYIRGAYMNAVRQSFATCWHRSAGTPSDYIWDKFGADYDGIAIRTTPNRMLEAVQPIMDIGAAHFGVVRYIDHDIYRSGTRNILQTQFLVQSCYRREQEARLLIHTFGPSGSKLVGISGPRGPLVRIRITRHASPRHEFAGGYKRGTAIVLPTRPTKFIEEIIVGHRVDDLLYKDVLLKSRALAVPCRRL
jgi:hypothetical protein